MPSLFQLSLVPLLILLNAFFVAAEYAVVAIRPGQLEALSKRSPRAAAAMRRLKDNPSDAIGAIQVCITMTNLLLGWFGESALTALVKSAIGPLSRFIPETAFQIFSTAVGFLIVTFLTVVFSEMVPKALTLRYVPAVANFTAIPVYAILRITKPLVWLMNFAGNLVTRPLGLGRVDDDQAPSSRSTEEIRLLTHEAAAQGTLTSRERSLILNSLSLGRRSARQIMVPRVRVAYLDLQRSMQDNRAVMNERLYSRLPLCDGGMDNVIGVVSTKEFLSAYFSEGDSSVLSLISRPATFAPETIPLDRLLLLFDKEKTQLVFLVDETGGVEGIATLRDVVDELVDEPLPESPGRLIVAGDTPLHDIADRIGRPDWCANEDVITIGGLLSERLGRIPRAGDQYDEAGVALRVLEANGRSVQRVAVNLLSPNPTKPATP